MTAGSAEKRVALVIGNALYKHADTLKNPANDAKAIGAALTRLGFTGANPRLNLDYNGLRQALQDFSTEADDADMAVLYFAGHGVEVDGRNFLVPVDARLERSKAVDFETASLDQALNAVEGARQLRLIILDACRNNPFRARMLRSGGARSIGQGLRLIEPGGNVLVAYAAKHGTFALDGRGGNSPFAEALKDHIEQPGLEIGQLFREVRDDVLERTGREQEPHLYGSLGRGMIYLKPPPPIIDVVERTPHADGAMPGPTPPAHPLAWLTAVIAGLSATVGALALALWLQQPPSSPSRDAGGGTQAPIASAEDGPQHSREDADRLAKADDAALANALRVDTKEALTAYLKDYAQGRNVAAARAALMRLGFVEVAVGAANDLRWIRAGGGAQDSETFKDCADCPRMVVLPPGEFLMGSPKGEAGRSDDEGPQHKVSIATAFAMGRTHVTRGEFAAFVKATDYKTIGGCWGHSGKEWTLDENRSWQSPGFNQGDDHPVSCVSWNAASAYAKWLTSRTNKTYRLMSEAEAEYAARGTTEAKPQPRYFFGDDENDLCRHANGSDRTESAKLQWAVAPCQDGHIYTAPVASFRPNAFGLYDVHGNAWSWTEDCWNASYRDKPEQLTADGGAWTVESCSARVLRGGSWLNDPRSLRSAVRLGWSPDNRNYDFGFRVARNLSPF